MRLSVVVPVYKAQDYLDACVQSILAQSFAGFELILVDDGSPDSSGAMCDAWAKKDRRIHVIHQPNGGISSARNAGLDAAKGEYVAFVDSDDTVEPKTYATCLARAAEGNHQVVCFGYRVVGEKTACMSMRAFEIRTLAALEPWFMEYTSTAALFGAVWNKLYQVDFLRQNGLRFDESIKMNEDEPFNFSVLRHLQRMAYIDDCLYNYYMRENASITRAGSTRVYRIGMDYQRHAEAFFDATGLFAPLRAEYLEGRRQRALFNHYNQLTGRNALRYAQRREALRELCANDSLRAALQTILAAQPGAGAKLGRLCLRRRWPGLLALAATLRNRLT